MLRRKNRFFFFYLLGKWEVFFCLVTLFSNISCKMVQNVRNSNDQRRSNSFCCCLHCMGLELFVIFSMMYRRFTDDVLRKYLNQQGLSFSFKNLSDKYSQLAKTSKSHSSDKYTFIKNCVD